MSFRYGWGTSTSRLLVSSLPVSPAQAGMDPTQLNGGGPMSSDYQPNTKPIPAREWLLAILMLLRLC